MTEGPIVVGVDGSQGAGRALEWAAKQAKATGAGVILVHGFRHPALMIPIENPLVPQDVFLEATEQLRTFAKQSLEGKWAAPLASRHVGFRTLFVEEQPAAAILRVGDEENASLIVVGSRGLGGLRGPLLGSVSSYVVHHAKRPVAVIPDATAVG